MVERDDGVTSTTIRDGYRYCTSHCGRLLTLASFYRNGRGYPNTECRDCARVRSRNRYRKLARYVMFLRAEADRKRAAYKTRKAAV